MAKNNEEIISLYRFTDKQRKTFPYIDAYMNAIDSWLTAHQFDSEQLLRYMLVGLFLEYRATNHHGDNFSTDISRWSHIDRRPETKQKLETINEYLAEPIHSTDEYLDRLQANDIDSLKRLADGGLFLFVINDGY